MILVLTEPPTTEEADAASVAQALQLDEAECGHLFDLARAANATARPRRRPALQRVRPGVQRILDAMTDTPADLRNGRRDILAANRLGYALYSEIFVDPVRPANVARFVFLSPRARAFFPDWEGVANDLVANLRTEAGRNPHDRALQDLVGELSTRSQEFGSRWAAHNVRQHQTGRKRLHHPVVGDLELTYEVLALPADPGCRWWCTGPSPGLPPRTASSSWPAGRRPWTNSTSHRQPRRPTNHDRRDPRPAATEVPWSGTSFEADGASTVGGATPARGHLTLVGWLSFLDRGQGGAAPYSRPHAGHASRHVAHLAAWLGRCWGAGNPGRGGSDVTDERRPRPSSSRGDRPVSDEEFRAALERDTDLSLREDPERRRYYRAGDLPRTGSPGDDPAAPWHHRGELLTWNGETLTVARWSQRTGIEVKTLLARCRKGWSVERVLTTPPGGDPDG